MLLSYMDTKQFNVLFLLRLLMIVRGFPFKHEFYNPINSINIDIIKDLSNEIILIDTANEGLKDSFDERVFNYLDINYNRLVISGGIGRKTIKLAKNFALRQ